MKSDYKPLGKYIRQVDVRNTDLLIDNLLGVSISKEYIPSIANIIGTDLRNYKVVCTGQFAYGPVTSRNGDKVSIALLRGNDCIISSSYTVFEIVKPDELDAEYLMLWFSRPEFDRYARFMSHGSVREIFGWDELCMVELPMPPIDEQRNIVRAYKAITDRIELKRKINDNLTETAQTIYRSMFVDTKCQFEHKPLAELCSKIGSGATPKGGKTAYCDTGITLIRSTNVVDYGFIYDGLAHITNEQADALSNVVVNAGDVLFNITGVSVARCCIVPDDVIPARVNQHVMIIRPIMGKDMSFYIMATLCRSENKSKLLGIAQSGSTREAINKQEMEQFSIPVPSEAAINEFGRKIDPLFARISANINEIRRLLDTQRLLLSRLSSR